MLFLYHWRKKKKKNFITFFNWEEKNETGAVKNLKKSNFGLQGLKLTEDYVGFYSHYDIYVIDIKKKEIASTYSSQTEICKICKINYDKIIYGDWDGNIIQLKLERNGSELTSFSEKKKAHFDDEKNFGCTIAICCLSDGHVATGGNDQKIKIWQI